MRENNHQPEKLSSTRLFQFAVFSVMLYCCKNILSNLREDSGFDDTWIAAIAVLSSSLILATKLTPNLAQASHLANRGHRAKINAMDFIGRPDHFALGEMYRDDKNISKAVYHFQQAVLAPMTLEQTTEAHRYIQKCYQLLTDKNRDEEAVIIAERYFLADGSLHPQFLSYLCDEPQRFIKLGQQLKSQGNCKLAYDVFTSVPKNNQAHTGLYQAATPLQYYVGQYRAGRLIYRGKVEGTMERAIACFMLAAKSPQKKIAELSIAAAKACDKQPAASLV